MTYASAETSSHQLSPTPDRASSTGLSTPSEPCTGTVRGRASEYDESTSKVELVRCNVKANHYSTRIDNLCKIFKVTPESKIVLETLINKVKEVKKLVSEDKLTSEDVLVVNESLLDLSVEEEDN
ncbi:hypothetical protein J6590_088456 [Homalodisca vitripennis]|nr:hypothetical protein J6590_088456 [Homalodisca vitripennis]